MKYKHLTKELKNVLIKQIKLYGKDELYKNIKYNLNIEDISDLMNMPNAFDKCNRNNCEYLWEYNFKFMPKVLDKNNISLGEEMLHFINSQKD